MSLNFLSSKQLNSLFDTMVVEAKLAETEPLDLLQFELSYLFNGEIVTFLLHVPSMPLESILRLK